MILLYILYKQHFLFLGLGCRLFEMKLSCQPFLLNSSILRLFVYFFLLFIIFFISFYEILGFEYFFFFAALPTNSPLCFNHDFTKYGIVLCLSERVLKIQAKMWVKVTEIRSLICDQLVSFFRAVRMVFSIFLNLFCVFGRKSETMTHCSMIKD